MEKATKPRRFHRTRRQLKAHEVAVATFSAGLIEKMAVYPLELVKTRLQVVGAECPSNGRLLPYTMLEKRMSALTTKNILRGVVEVGGITRMYTGLIPTLLGHIPQTMLRLTLNERVKASVYGSPFEPLSYPRLAAAGMVCGAIESVVVAPKEVIRQYMQTQTMGTRGASYPKSMPAVCSYIYSNYGIRAFFSCFDGVLLRQMLFGSLLFSSFEFFKRYYSRKFEMNGFKRLQCGIFAGVIAGVASTPIDVAKTRVQRQLLGYESLPVVHAIGRVYADDGVKGLFKGAGVRSFRLALGTGVCMAAYDNITHLIKNADV